VYHVDPRRLERQPARHEITEVTAWGDKTCQLPRSLGNQFITPVTIRGRQCVEEGVLPLQRAEDGRFESGLQAPRHADQQDVREANRVRPLL